MSQAAAVEKDVQSQPASDSPATPDAQDASQTLDAASPVSDSDSSGSPATVVDVSTDSASPVDFDNAKDSASSESVGDSNPPLGDSDASANTPVVVDVVDNKAAPADAKDKNKNTTSVTTESPNNNAPSVTDDIPKDSTSVTEDSSVPKDSSPAEKVPEGSNLPVKPDTSNNKNNSPVTVDIVNESTVPVADKAAKVSTARETAAGSSPRPVIIDIADENTPAKNADDSAAPVTPNGANDSPLPLAPNGADDLTVPLIAKDADNSRLQLIPPSPSSKNDGIKKRSVVKRIQETPCLESSRMATSLEDITSLRLWKGIIAEFVGVLLLVLVGCGSCMSLEEGGSSSVVQIALCFGLSVATIVWNIAHISGGHINPAVTLALLATRKISLAKAIFFVLFQLVGAVVGAGILMGLTPEKYQGNLGSTLVNDNIDPGKGLGVEIFITFVLVFTVFASIDSKRRDLNGSTPLTIGLSVTMCHLFAIQYTGSSMNTARSFGPALVSGNWDNHWVYWVGPITGGVAAGLIYEYLFAVNASLVKVRACVLSSDYDDDKFQAKKIKVRIVEEDPEGTGENLPMAHTAEKPLIEEP